MNLTLTLVVAATTASLIPTVFFVLKYGGYAFTTVPDWPIMVIFAVAVMAIALWFVNNFLKRDSLSVAMQTNDVSVVDLPVKSTAYAPSLFRYHPMRLFSKKAIGEAASVPTLSHGWQSSVPVTREGICIKIIKKNYVPRKAIESITIMQKGDMGEIMTVMLRNGSYYRIGLRLENPEVVLSELENMLRDFGYPVRIIHNSHI